MTLLATTPSNNTEPKLNPETKKSPFALAKTEFQMFCSQNHHKTPRVFWTHLFSNQKKVFSKYASRQGSSHPIPANGERHLQRPRATLSPRDRRCPTWLKLLMALISYISYIGFILFISSSWHIPRLQQVPVSVPYPGHFLHPPESR